MKYFIHLIHPGETLIVSTALAPPPKKHVQINYPPHQTTNSAPPILIVRNNNSGIKMQKSANEVSSNISTRYEHSICITIVSSRYIYKCCNYILCSNIQIRSLWQHSLFLNVCHKCILRKMICWEWIYENWK